MKRREFITILGSAAAWSLMARAQQNERIPRVGVLIPYLDNDTEAQAQMAAFRDGLEKLGLVPGRSVQIDERWAAGDFGVLRRAAKELVILRPDVIISRSTAATAALLYETRTKPVVFLVISDPVGDGFVVSLVHPGGHATGFTDIPASMARQWVELLKEMAPGISRGLETLFAAPAQVWNWHDSEMPGNPDYFRLLMCCGLPADLPAD